MPAGSGFKKEPKPTKKTPKQTKKPHPPKKPTHPNLGFIPANI